MKLALVVAIAACGPTPVAVRTTDTWPQQVADYDDVVAGWTRRTTLRGQYQEAAELLAVFESPDWRAAHAAHDAETRGLAGSARDAVFAQARADMAGPYEVEILFTTWDRKENDLDRGKRSLWKVVLVDDRGDQIEPLEIVKDKRPLYQLKAEFPTFADWPTFGDFGTAYVARFAHQNPILGDNVKAIRLRISSERGGLEVVWAP